jgi:hypothetical protein
VSTWDKSCKSDGDCIEVSEGHSCYTNELCGGSVVSASEQGRYNAAIAPLMAAPFAYSCPPRNRVRCVGGTCAICPAGTRCPSGLDGGGD